MRLIHPYVAALSYWAAALAQTAPARPQFEVASVKPSPAPDGPLAQAMIRAQEASQGSMPPGFLPMKGDTVTLRNRSLRQLISSAHRVAMNNVSGPGWISELRFDIEAKVPAGAPAGTAHEMLQALLEERFALRTHRETRTVTGYALVVAKDGPRLAPPTEPAAQPSPEERKRQMDKLMEQARQRGGSFSTWGSNSATAAQIAEAVSRMIHAPVTDQTGLEGKYSVTVEVPPAESPDDPMEHRVAQAVAKLGLKLESRKTTVSVLVVDSASKTPTEN